MPTSAELFRLALHCHQIGDYAQVESLYREILRADPGNVDAHNNLGDALLRQDRVAEATECFQEALRIDPRHANAHYNLGNVFLRQGQVAEAIECYRQALLFNPHHPSMHVNLGNALKDQGQLAEAIACYRQALCLSPDHPDAHNNQGLALVGQGEFAQAEASFQKTLRLDPGHRMALWNLSCLRLQQGDLAGAWAANENRWARPGIVPRSFKQPRWDGSPLSGKTILVYAEQGLGDTIQFVRFLPQVQERGGKVVFECQREFSPLPCTQGRGVGGEGLESGATQTPHPNPSPLSTGARGNLFACLKGVNELIPAGAPLPPFDVHIPLLSLPGIFGTTLADIPAEIPYLSADPKLVEHWRHELFGHRTPAAVGPRLNVGIAWQGNPHFPGDSLRSIPLKYFKKLAQVQGVRLVSLQKEKKGTDQLPAWAGRVSILDLSDRLETFCDTAAVMKNLDLIVSSCTSVPHLAGALGVPVWTVLQFVPDWRWFLDRSDSPWYPTMRLFRQKKLGDWDEVFERIAIELQKL